MSGKSTKLIYPIVAAYLLLISCVMIITHSDFKEPQTEMAVNDVTQSQTVKNEEQTKVKEDKEKVNEDKTKKNNPDKPKPMVALSFDDGPAFTYEGANSTQRILDVLEKYDVRATFFMCGERICSDNADCLKREIELGCELGNHTYDHKHYGDKVTRDDIKKSSDAIKKSCGKAPSIFRCPGGIITKSIQKECEAEGMPIAYWSVDTEDWKSKDPQAIYKKAVSGAYDGAIILMHDIYPSTADAVEKIVPKLIEQGYQIVTVSEMLTAKNAGKPPKPGQQYVDYKTINNNTK